MSVAARILATILSWLWWWVIPIRKHTAISAFQTHFPTEPVTQLREMMALIILQYLYILIGKKATINWWTHQRVASAFVRRAGLGHLDAHLRPFIH